jgi:hypothetical protein
MYRTVQIDKEIKRKLDNRSVERERDKERTPEIKRDKQKP